MSVNERTVSGWERNQEPLVGHYPAIIAFLGREPWPEPKTLPERLVAGRRRRGLTIDAAAACLGVDPSTWWWWESGRKPHRRADRMRLDEFIRGAGAEQAIGGVPHVEAEPIPPIGQLLRDRRKVLGLTQRQAAAELHINEFTLMHWELDRHQPAHRYYPTLIRYLGREPWPEPISLGARLRAERLRHGFTIAQLAGVLRVDEGALADWERGLGPKHQAQIEKIAAFIEGRPQRHKRCKQ
jgi:transcriptional regulator with XRE-family HTH domain